MTITAHEALLRCMEHREIFYDEMLVLFRQIMQGEMSPVLMAALIMGLRVKKESIGEITAAAQVMREFSVKVPMVNTHDLLDIAGTGGDGARTFNISTAAMFVAAAAGARVAKHGGRSVSSTSGGADVLEALGVNIHLKPEQIVQSIAQAGIGFMFAPQHHTAMKYAQGVRKELGIRTIFNILGPLTNPAGAQNILMGVFHPDLVGIQIRVLQRLGARRALVVWGRDNMDELSLGAATMVGELINGEIREYELHPEDFGFKMTSSRHFQVDGVVASQQKIIEVLENKGGSASDIVAFNAGAALYTVGMAASIAEGVIQAQQALASGAARAKLDQFIKITQQLSKESIETFHKD